LNDDRQEKAIRFQSRQALHDIQINQIKAAASPVRKPSTNAMNASPQTPHRHNVRGKENYEDDAILSAVPNGSTTPIKRVPILANFEEWMKMATDNKINATNSWNFALIDYFHDMSLLKEGDGVNFQKASCTLDGCVKIYTSRVDSVATETGKLLSGLANGTSKKHKQGIEGEDEQEGEDDDEDGEGTRRLAKKKVGRACPMVRHSLTPAQAQRSSEATLAPSFAQLQLKKLELEFTVDPLFKKASADFDEGGAKGLLLNHLAIDGQGRIVFDSSDDADINDVETPNEVDQDSKQVCIETIDGLTSSTDIDIAGLGYKYFAELPLLDEQDICPSLKTFDIGDPKASLDLPTSQDFDGAQPSQDDDLSPTDGVDAMDTLNDGADGFDENLLLLADASFGDGGEVWAQCAALQPAMSNHTIPATAEHEDGMSAEMGDLGTDGVSYKVALDIRGTYGQHDTILQYFDKTLLKNWAGPEHWRIKRVKDTKAGTTPPARRKERETFEVNFASPLNAALSDTIFTPAASASVINLPKSQWRSQSRNLLPDDKHFNSRQLLRLFLKPRAHLGTPRSGNKVLGANSITNSAPGAQVDEAYWARQGDKIEDDSSEAPASADYDADFFQDAGLGLPQGLPDDDDEFSDAREVFSPDFTRDAQSPITVGGQRVVAGEQEGPGAFGAQLVTQSKRLRPEYVQYARVAKKVDVRRLKEEMWKGIGFKNVCSLFQSFSHCTYSQHSPRIQLKHHQSIQLIVQLFHSRYSLPRWSMAYKAFIRSR
jgi:condensin complex subunit 2